MAKSNANEPTETYVEFVVPLLPPSVNHYVKHSRAGRHYVTAEAKAFKEAVKILGPKFMVGNKKSIYATKFIFELGKGIKGDGSNFLKVLEDALVDAGIIHSDAAIMQQHWFKKRAALSSTRIIVWKL